MTSQTVSQPELHNNVVWRTLDLYRDQLLKVANPVCIERDLQWLVSIDVHSATRRLHVDKLTEQCVSQLDMEHGWNQTTVGQHDLVAVRGLSEDRASVQGVK